MRNIVLNIRYDGTNYHGWQQQKNAVSVQETLNKAIHKVTGEQVVIHGCGRTDAGVHALDYCCNFLSSSSVPCDKFPLALNSVLPYDIAVWDCKEVDKEFHARFSAKKKTYVYKINNSKTREPLLHNYSYHYPKMLNLSAMRKAASQIIGRRDYKAFMATGGMVKTTVRTVEAVSVSKKGSMIEIVATADGFLYNMVRIIAGTLIYTGIGKINPMDINAIIEKGDRTLAGITVPPQGLYLKQVYY